MIHWGLNKRMKWCQGKRKSYLLWWMWEGQSCQTGRPPCSPGCSLPDLIKEKSKTKELRHSFQAELWILKSIWKTTKTRKMRWILKDLLSLAWWSVTQARETDEKYGIDLPWRLKLIVSKKATSHYCWTSQKAQLFLFVQLSAMFHCLQLQAIIWTEGSVAPATISIQQWHHMSNQKVYLL